MCTSALSRARVNPPGASRARARLLIYFDISLRKLRARAYPPPPAPPAPSRRSLPVPFATTSFSGGYKSRAAPMAAGNSRNFTFESYASAALCGSSSAASGDNFGRISANLRVEIKATPSDERAEHALACLTRVGCQSEFGRNLSGQYYIRER